MAFTNNWRRTFTGNSTQKVRGNGASNAIGMTTAALPIQLTDDKGGSWQPISGLNFIRDAYWDGTNTIWAVNLNSVNRSLDGGFVWQTVTSQSFPSGFPDDFNCVTFRSSIGYIGTTNGKVYKTNNTGNSYVIQNLPVATQVEDIYEFAGSGAVAILITGSKIYKTTNGGGIWTEKTNPTGQQLSAIAFNADDSVGFISVESTAGKVLKTTDGGETWSEIIVDAGFTFYDMTEANGVWTVSGHENVPNGDRVWYSEDDGATWIAIHPGDSGSSNQLLSAYMFNKSEGVAATNANEIGLLTRSSSLDGKIRSLDPAHLFRFEDNFLDEGTNPSTATPVGTPEFEDGTIGRSYKTNGTDQAVDLGILSELHSSTEFTVIFMSRILRLDDPANTLTGNEDNPSQTFNSARFQLNSGGQGVVQVVQANETGANQTVTSSKLVDDSGDHLFVYRWDVTEANEMAMWVSDKDESIADVQSHDSLTSNAASTGTFLGSGKNLELPTAMHTEFFAVFGRALTDAEIDDLNTSFRAEASSGGVPPGNEEPPSGGGSPPLPEPIKGKSVLKGQEVDLLRASLADQCIYDPTIRVEVYDDDGVTLKGEVQTINGSAAQSDGDLAGSGSAVVYDKDRLIKQWDILKIYAGYEGVELPIYRGRVQTIAEDVPLIGQSTIQMIDGIADIFSQEVITPFFDESYTGFDGQHSGAWTRSQIAADIAKQSGIEIGAIEDNYIQIKQEPFTNETVADAIAKTLMPEFMKARINENGKMDIFHVRNSGDPDHEFDERNIVDIAPINYKIEPLISEVYIEGQSADAKQVAFPPNFIQDDTVTVEAGSVNVSEILEIPQSKTGDTMNFAVCVDEPDGYQQENFNKAFSYNTRTQITIDFKSPKDKHLWAVKDLTLVQASAGGDPSGSSNWFELYVIYADKTCELLVRNTSNGFTLTNWQPSPSNRPVMGFVFHGFSSSSGGSPRNGSFNIDVNFTRMTEREMQDAGILKLDFVDQGGASVSDPCGSPFDTINIYDHGLKTVGEITITKDDTTTDEFNLGLLKNSTWEFDDIRCVVRTHAQLWSTVRPQILVFRKVNQTTKSLVGTRKISIENSSIATEQDANRIIDAIVGTQITERGQAISEYSWTMALHPHVRPGDLCRIEFEDVDFIEQFDERTPTLYILGITNNWNVDQDGTLVMTSQFRAIRADQSGQSVFRNLSVDLLKERADIQSQYLSSLPKARVINVNEVTATTSSSSVADRTDANTYDVELLSEDGVVLERVSNSFNQPYVETDIVFVQFQNANRNKPFLVGLVHSSFSSDESDTRDVEDTPQQVDDTCIRITSSSLPSGNVGIAYSANLSSSGGQHASQWLWTYEAGNIPSGLTITNDDVLQNTRSGTITGIPTQTGTFIFCLVTEDDRGNRGIENVRITVNG